jgi:tRNA/tmRNA/rRNA uracil-C5-methylase (TrmA/RlmC/RlmD family)
MTRRPRARQPRGRSRVGERFEVEVGAIAHGGHCVARLPPESGTADNRVVFVRHALPGELAVIEITDGTEGDKFWRADAVAISAPSEDRVVAPCRFAGPGRCGGCDFQHVSLPRQRELKGQVVHEQLRRLAGLDVEVVVEAVPGDVEGLGWRTRQSYVELPGGRHGMRKHRSHDVIEIDECLIATADAQVGAEQTRGPVTETVACRYGTHVFDVAADGFWQVHPGAPATLVDAVLDVLAPRDGESALDLYAGVGLFSRFLADSVSPTGRVVAVEAHKVAVGNAQTNLEGLAGVEVVRGSVEKVLATAYAETFDLVVLDPPRTGAKRPVVEQVVARSPRAVAYVACDPGALARDVAIFAEHGYRLDGLRAFDLFPMTSHVECVALLEKTDADLRRSDMR